MVESCWTPEQLRRTCTYPMACLLTLHSKHAARQDSSLHRSRGSTHTRTTSTAKTQAALTSVGSICIHVALKNEHEGDETLHGWVFALPSCSLARRETCAALRSGGAVRAFLRQVRRAAAARNLGLMGKLTHFLHPPPTPGGTAAAGVPAP